MPTLIDTIECDQPRDQCLPVITSFTPKNGSIYGGTFLTINGYNFGSNLSVLPVVKVAGIVSLIHSFNNSMINCRTGLMNKTLSGLIEVSTIVNNIESTTGGIAVSKGYFTYTQFNLK